MVLSVLRQCNATGVNPHKGELIHDHKGELESQLNVAVAIKENNLTLTAFKLK